MPRSRLLLAVAVVAGGCAEISAADAGGPRWACRYDPDHLTVRCLLAEDAAAGVVRSPPSAIEHRLPPIVRAIREQPGRFAGRAVHIPLWNVPYEMAFARQLAESVMCGARDDCHVDFDPGELTGFTPPRPPERPRRRATLR